MLSVDEPVRLQYLRRRVARMEKNYRRGMVTERELNQVREALKREEEKPRRVQDPEPPVGAQSVRVQMDRVTELALEHLMNVDLGRKLEKAELFRVALRKWALARGWVPPEEPG